MCRSHNERRPAFVKTPVLPSWKPEDEEEDRQAKDPDAAPAPENEGEGLV